MKKNNITFTECSKCGVRYENYFHASPCCRSIILKVDENGNRTTITFLSTLSLPQANFVKLVRAKTQEPEHRNQTANLQDEFLE